MLKFENGNFFEKKYPNEIKRFSRFGRLSSNFPYGILLRKTSMYRFFQIRARGKVSFVSFARVRFLGWVVSLCLDVDLRRGVAIGDA